LPGWTAASGDATAVIGTGPTNLWAAVGGALLQGDGATWWRALAPEDVGGRILGVWASGPDDVWGLGGDSLIPPVVGGKWTTDNPPPRPASGLEMHAISGTGPNDVWVLRGTDSVLHWDGANWISRMPGVDNLRDVWAAGPNDAWVAGDSLVRWHNDGWS